MAVDVMHLSAAIPSSSPRRSPGHMSLSSSPSPGHKAGRKQQQLQKELSRSSQDLHTVASSSPSRSSVGGDSLSASELSWCGLPEEQQAVECIQHCRKQLEEEIDVSVGSLLGRGEAAG